MRRLPSRGAAFLSAALLHWHVDLLLAIGAGFVASGAWFYSEGAGKIVLGVFLLILGLIRIYGGR